MSAPEAAGLAAMLEQWEQKARAEIEYSGAIYDPAEVLALVRACRGLLADAVALREMLSECVGGISATMGDLQRCTAGPMAARVMQRTAEKGSAALADTAYLSPAAAPPAPQEGAPE